MKATLLSLLVLATPLASFACPGGHLKSLVIDGVQVAELNMTDSSVRATDGTSVITAVTTMTSIAYQGRELCGHSEVCDANVLLDVDVLQDPEAIVVVHVRRAGQNSSDIFKLTNFHQTRAVNSCGEAVKPLR